LAQLVRSEVIEEQKENQITVSMADKDVDVSIPVKYKAAAKTSSNGHV